MLKNKVRELRKANGLSQAELGKEVNLSDPQISEIERGLKRINQDSIPIFCKALNCTPNDLFGYNAAPDDITINLNLLKRLIDAIGKLSPDLQLKEIEVLELRVSRK